MKVKNCLLKSLVLDPSSFIDALIELTGSVRLNSQRNIAINIFLDLKAFGALNHDFLPLKLERYGMW